MVHPHIELGQVAEEIFEKLKSKECEEMGDEEFDQYLEEVSRIHQVDPTASNADPSLLNRSQKEIYNRLKRFLLEKKDASETGTDPPDPLHYPIHGGPGRNV